MFRSAMSCSPTAEDRAHLGKERDAVAAKLDARNKKQDAITRYFGDSDNDSPPGVETNSDEESKPTLVASDTDQEDESEYAGMPQLVVSDDESEYAGMPQLVVRDDNKRAVTF